jgi:hypothetical protein
VVQFAKDRRSNLDYAVKFFTSRSAFQDEARLFTDKGNPLGKFLPDVRCPSVAALPLVLCACAPLTFSLSAAVHACAVHSQEMLAFMGYPLQPLHACVADHVWHDHAQTPLQAHACPSCIRMAGHHARQPLVYRHPCLIHRSLCHIYSKLVAMCTCSACVIAAGCAGTG